MDVHIFFVVLSVGALGEVHINVTNSINLGQEDLTVACRYITNDPAVTDVNSIQLYRNTSGLLGSEESKTVSIVYDRGSNAGLISWQDSGVEIRANISGNVDSLLSSILLLHIPANQVLCEDGATYRCEFSVTRSGSPLVEFNDATILTREGPKDISFSTSSSEQELFSNATFTLYPANTSVTLICNVTVGSQPLSMQLCFNSDSEHSETGFVPLNMSSISDSGIMANGACNNFREFHFEYHLGTNVTATFLCLTGQNTTCANGIVEGSFTISSVETHQTTTNNPSSPETETWFTASEPQNGTLFTTDEPITETSEGVTGNDVLLTSIETDTESESWVTATQPDTENGTWFTTNEVDTESWTSTESNPENHTLFTTTEFRQENETLLSSTIVLFSTSSDIEDLLTTVESSSENYQNASLPTVTQPDSTNGRTTDNEMVSQSTEPNLPDNGGSTEDVTSHVMATETVHAITEDLSTDIMNNSTSISVVTENTSQQTTSEKEFTNSSLAPITTNSFSTLTDFNSNEETSEDTTLVFSTMATETSSIDSIGDMTSSLYHSSTISNNTGTTRSSIISSSQEDSTSSTLLTTSSDSPNTPSSTTIGAPLTSTTGTPFTTTTRAPVTSTPGRETTTGASFQKARSSVLNSNAYLLVIVCILLA
ncbi:serine-rich adhesin for platelets-like [Saccostrea cucullata]|uniref:serine-rich adhesin for platelets-like n=1 Tax=Saccostrea cuccullata TaxID=36930 RepID=UPI002ED431C1